MDANEREWPEALVKPAPLRAVITPGWMAWLNPHRVMTIRQMTDEERLAKAVPAVWGMALRVRVSGDEVWIVRGDPWPAALADIIEDGACG